ncbi:unnamed protein product [Boreogadus saida]
MQQLLEPACEMGRMNRGVSPGKREGKVGRFGPRGDSTGEGERSARTLEGLSAGVLIQNSKPLFDDCKAHSNIFNLHYSEVCCGDSAVVDDCTGCRPKIHGKAKPLLKFDVSSTFDPHTRVYPGVFNDIVAISCHSDTQGAPAITPGARDTPLKGTPHITPPGVTSNIPFKSLLFWEKGKKKKGGLGGEVLGSDVCFLP